MAASSAPQRDAARPTIGRGGEGFLEVGQAAHLRIFQPVARDLEIAVDRLAAEVAEADKALLELALDLELAHAAGGALALEALDEGAELGLALHGEVAGVFLDVFQTFSRCFEDGGGLLGGAQLGPELGGLALGLGDLAGGLGGGLGQEGLAGGAEQ